jgi:hypothetical protein
MNVILFRIVGFLVIAILFRDILRKLISGKLLARGLKVYARGDSPTLYWSTMALEIIVTLAFCCIVLISFLPPIP